MPWLVLMPRLSLHGPAPQASDSQRLQTTENMLGTCTCRLLPGCENHVAGSAGCSSAVCSFCTFLAITAGPIKCQLARFTAYCASACPLQAVRQVHPTQQQPLLHAHQASVSDAEAQEQSISLPQLAGVHRRLRCSQLAAHSICQNMCHIHVISDGLSAMLRASPHRSSQCIAARPLHIFIAKLPSSR